MKMLRTTITLVLGVLILSGCGGRKAEPSRSLEQIQREEGVPVKVEIATPHTFVRELTYTATLSGALQTSEYAKVGGRINRVNVKVGDRVEKDQVLVEFPTDLPSVQFESIKAGYELARTTCDRIRALYAKGGVSRQELDNAETQLKSAETHLDAANQMLKVRAPMSGIVTEVAVNESDNVRSDDLLFTISKLDRMKATIWVAENEIAEVRKGMTVTCSWNGTETSGSVTDVAMAMDQARKAFAVDVETANPGAALKAGVLAEVRLRTYVNPNAFVVARKTLRTDSNGSYVFLDDNGKARRQPVVTNRNNGLYIEIASGLKEGDRVIVEGLSLIDDGSKLNVLE